MPSNLCDSSVTPATNAPTRIPSTEPRDIARTRARRRYGAIAVCRDGGLIYIRASFSLSG